MHIGPHASKSTEQEIEAFLEIAREIQRIGFTPEKRFLDLNKQQCLENLIKDTQLLESSYARNPTVCLYAGIIAANCGFEGLLQKFLENISLSHHGVNSLWDNSTLFGKAITAALPPLEQTAALSQILRLVPIETLNFQTVRYEERIKILIFAAELTKGGKPDILQALFKRRELIEDLLILLKDKLEANEKEEEGVLEVKAGILQLGTGMVDHVLNVLSKMRTGELSAVKAGVDEFSATSPRRKGFYKSWSAMRAGVRVESTNKRVKKESPQKSNSSPRKSSEGGPTSPQKTAESKARRLFT